MIANKKKKMLGEDEYGTMEKIYNTAKMGAEPATNKLNLPLILVCKIIKINPK